MSTLKIVIKKDKINQKGEAPICLRITRDRKSKYVSLGYSVNPQLWDVNIGRVKRAHPNSVRLNSMLNNKITDATDFVLETPVNIINNNKFFTILPCNGLMQKPLSH